MAKPCEDCGMPGVSRFCQSCARVRHEAELGRAALKAMPDVTPGRLTQLAALWAVCKKFVETHQIGGSESVHQDDDVILNAYDFIEAVCEVVGYYSYPQEEATGEKEKAGS